MTGHFSGEGKSILSCVWDKLLKSRSNCLEIFPVRGVWSLGIFFRKILKHSGFLEWKLFQCFSTVWQTGESLGNPRLHCKDPKVWHVIIWSRAVPGSGTGGDRRRQGVVPGNLALFVPRPPGSKPRQGAGSTPGPWRFCRAGGPGSTPVPCRGHPPARDPPNPVRLYWRAQEL